MVLLQEVSFRNVIALDICAALCFFLPTDSLVTVPCDITPLHTSHTDEAFWVGRLVLKKQNKKSLASLSCCIPSH